MNTEAPETVAATTETRRGRKVSQEVDANQKIAELEAKIETLIAAQARAQTISPGVVQGPPNDVVELNTSSAIKRLGTHPDDPIATGRTRVLVSDSPSLTVILRPTVERVDATGNKWAAHPALKVQFDNSRAIVDEGLLPLIKNHPAWRSARGGIFDPSDPGSPRPRRSGPQVVEGVATGVRPESDMEPLPRWDSMDAEECVAAINDARVHPMDAFTYEGRPSGRRRPAVLEAATARLVNKQSNESAVKVDSFSAPIPEEA